MGNLCGKESQDNFQGPGRTVGAAPAPATKATVPARIAATTPKATGPGRAVGGGSGIGGGDNARSAAAAAAEVRSSPKSPVSVERRAVKPMVTTARASKAPTGDLAKKLETQKKQTQSQTLQQAASENRAQRDADAATEARHYN
ncbi:hypothetical protein BDV95DRAFT_620323 [Massariosphaeria phaeospora]|uniref:Uncharacterized protein n=1 Tax=Massariosphaeria phaeospora TaxID=100035 RepID=A0A7C8ML76_9PLEO|nr:hypothetical protein BDV95DRAFT_620323 [Massariosphaeria phaeospora]